MRFKKIYLKLRNNCWFQVGLTPWSTEVRVVAPWKVISTNGSTCFNDVSVFTIDLKNTFFDKILCKTKTVPEHLPIITYWNVESTNNIRQKSNFHASKILADDFFSFSPRWFQWSPGVFEQKQPQGTKCKWFLRL